MYLPGETNIVTIYMLNILAKMAYAPAVPLLWTMIADSSDYSEWKSGRRATGLYFSAATFAQKAGWGIGAAIAGWILTDLQLRPEAAADRNLAPRHQAAGFRHSRGSVHVLRDVHVLLHDRFPKTTDLMKKDLDARRAQGC